ncbi:MAG: hypothetical protein FI674_00040 [SAR202 cluster bacterium]|nr:hypothetical protein [SAR202 cluster bacterium]|tara:strand:- start:154 stop:987 length:834 start_codon:yes stop_codon:yes gene_type:complete
MVSGGFFGRISNTFKMIKSCMDVLKKDKELIFFPIFAALSVGLLILIISTTGALDNLDPEQGGDPTPLIPIIFVANFLIVFFNSALVSAALERLRGGDPNVRSGLSHALKHIHHIFFWSIIVTIVAILIAAIKGSRRDGIVRNILGSMLQAGWAMMTFFVVPIIVSENLGPISAIKRSTSLFKKTWGDQVIANFGFGIFQILAILASVVIGWFFGIFSQVLGIGIGFGFAVISVAIIYTLEGIYKAALYEFALGEKPLEFQQEDLRTAYRSKAAAYS